MKYLETRDRNKLIAAAGETTYSIRDGQISMLYKCNQEEADTRLVLHASLEDNDVVVVSKYTDVLILLIWAYEKCNIQMALRNSEEVSNSNLNYQADDEMAVDQEVATKPVLIEEKDTSFADRSGNESDWENSDLLSSGDSGDEWMLCLSLSL